MLGAGEVSRAAEVRYRCKDGTDRWISVRSRMLLDGPSPGSRVVAVRDVHDELKEGQQLMVKVINVDGTGRIRLSRKALLAESAVLLPRVTVAA